MSGNGSTILITGAGGPLGCNVTRSLRAAPERLKLIGTDANRWHLPLSLCDQTYLIPKAKDRADYQKALVEIAEREKVEVIVPTHPVEVRAIAELRDAGKLGGMKTALPDTRVVAVCDDKFATQRCLQEAGLDVPRTILLNGPKDLERSFAELGTPVWIRGTGAPGLGIGGAALPTQSIGVGMAWVEHHNGWGKMAASEFLPGENLTWMGGFADGQLIAAGTRERLEYVLPHVSPSGITGAPAVSRTLFRKDVADVGERSVRAADKKPHGVYFVDMKVSDKGRVCITEINAGRCGTTVHFYTEAGYNFPWLLVRMARGEKIAPLPDPNAAVGLDLYWVRTLDCGPELVKGDAEFDRYPKIGR